MREDLLDSKGAAEYLGLSPHTIDNWCSAKRITYYKVGRDRRFKKADLDKIIEDGRIEAAK